jgi:hypothetical protein
VSRGRASTGTLVAVGYSYLVRKFDDPPGAEVKANTVSLSAEQAFEKNWALCGEYDLQVSQDSVAGTSTTDNIFSLALKYSY